MDGTTATPRHLGLDRAPAQLCEAVLFDVDDTLYEVAELVTQSWRVNAGSLADLGLDVEGLVAAYDQHRYRRTTPDALARALQHVGHATTLAESVHNIAQGYIPTRLAAYAGVTDLLATLRASGVRTGVVTNGEPDRQLAKLDALGLGGAFDVVVVCDGTRVPCKPHPAGFQAALAALDVPASRALMVGDRIDYDIIPALELGMHAVRIRLGNHAGRDADAHVIESDEPARVWRHVLEHVTTLRA